MMFPLVLLPPYFEGVYCFNCGRRRVAVARYRMICLVLVANGITLEEMVICIAYLLFKLLFSTRNAHMVHIVNLIRLKMVYTS